MRAMASDESYFPECWRDDERMASLFCEFRAREVNPQGYEGKMTFWKDLIVQRCEQTRNAVFSLECLKEEFSRKAKTPRCLSPVLAQMKREGTVISLYQFHNQTSGWLQWGFNVMVKSPLSWGWGLMSKSVGWSQPEKPEMLVHVGTIKRLAAAILQRHAKKVEADMATSSVVEAEQLRREVSAICSHHLTFDLVLLQLQKDDSIVLFEENMQKIVMFKKTGHAGPNKPSDSDVSIIRLQKAYNQVEKQIEKLSEERERYTQEAKLAVKTGQKSKAMAALKKRKRVEGELKNKDAILDNIEEMVHQLREVDYDKMLLSGFKAGVAALKEVTRRGLSADSIDTTMVELEDVMAAQGEIDDALGRPVVGFLEPDSEGLEDELNRILSEGELPAEGDEEPIGFKPTPTTNLAEDLPWPKVPEEMPRYWDAEPNAMPGRRKVTKSA